MRVEPLVTLIANDNWMEYTVRYVVPYRARRTTGGALFERILDAVDASQGRVTLASATFQVVETRVIDVRLVGPADPSAGQDAR